jgi:hypothetical protein
MKLSDSFVGEQILVSFPGKGKGWNDEVTRMSVGGAMVRHGLLQKEEKIASDVAETESLTRSSF